MAKYKFNTAQFYANNSNSIHDRRRKAKIASTEHAPRNVRISQRQARGTVQGVSLHDVRVLMRPDLNTSTKRAAKNGLTVREVVNACPWDRGRYE